MFGLSRGIKNKKSATNKRKIEFENDEIIDFGESSNDKMEIIDEKLEMFNKTKESVINKDKDSKSNTGGMLSFAEDEDEIYKTEGRNILKSTNSEFLNKKRNILPIPIQIHKQSLQVNLKEKYEGARGNAEKESINLIHDVDMDNFDNRKEENERIAAETRLFKSEETPLDEAFHEYDQPQFYEDEEVIANPNLDENYLDNPEALQNKIETIKNLREKKRLNEYKEENYDQDYLEMKQANSKDLINDVYNIIDHQEVFELRNLDDHSDTEKELMQWEMNKLKSGMNSIKFTQNAINKGSKGRGEGLFRDVNLNVDLDNIISQVREDVGNEELHYESLTTKLENLRKDQVEAENKKEIEIQKADNYIDQYLKLKNLYFQIVKEYKKHRVINKNKLNEKLGDETFYFSD